MITKILKNTQEVMRQEGLNHVPEKGSILEIGTNNGEQSAYYFLGKEERYIGIDNQLSKVQAARISFPSLKYLCLDCLSEKSKALMQLTDTLVSFQTLEHIGTKKGNEDLLLLSWLKPGAKIIISVPNFDSAKHVRFFSEKGWTKRFKTVMEIEKLFIYKSVKEYGIKQNSRSFLYIGHRI